MTTRAEHATALADNHLEMAGRTRWPACGRPRTSLAKEACLLNYLTDGPLAGQIPALFGYGRTETDQGGVDT
jgi:hypothetical protein